jgi:hypothetical protein
MCQLQLVDKRMIPQDDNSLAFEAKKQPKGVLLMANDDGSKQRLDDRVILAKPLFQPWHQCESRYKRLVAD